MIACWESGVSDVLKLVTCHYDASKRAEDLGVLRQMLRLIGAK